MINEHHQIIYYGGHNTGKSFTLNQKINNFFDNFKLIYMDESINFQTLFWEEDGDDVKIGLFIDFLIQAFSHPDEIFLFAFENIDKISNDLFRYLNTLSKRNEDGFSQNPQRIPNEKIFESIKKKINKNSWEKFEDLVFLDEIKINTVNQIFFPPNFYVWATTSNLDWFNSTPKKYWNQIHLDINNNEDFIKGVKLKIKFPNKSRKKFVFWNDFRKIINGFLIDELELNEDKLIGVFSINPQTLEDLKDNIDALSTEIINTVLSHLYYKINKFDSLLIFKEEYSRNFSEIQKTFQIMVLKFSVILLKIKFKN